MIQINKNSIENIPVLTVVQAEKMNESVPTVVYYHGFNGEKESSLTIAYKIAEKGFRVILPDSIFHGERRGNASQSEMELAFWEIVIQNIQELNEIKSYLEAENLVIPGQIGIGGTSMGGITTYGALKTYSWVKAAAVLMGSPLMTAHAKKLIEKFNQANERQITQEEKVETMKRLEQFDLSLHTEKLANRPLFIWHGEKDPIVPVQYSETFYTEIENQYTKAENLQFIIEKGRTHNISRLSIEETAKWFEKHL